MNEIIENMKTRRSIRKFKSDALPQDVLDRILEAGTYAPTGMAAQSPVIIAVTNKELRDKLFIFGHFKVNRTAMRTCQCTTMRCN